MKKKSVTLGIGSISVNVKLQSDRNADLFYSQFYYGHREILLNYLGQDGNSLLCGILQHGVRQIGLTPYPTDFQDFKTPRLGNWKRAPLWVYSQQTVAQLKKQGTKGNIQAIGAPWNYLKPGPANQTIDSKQESLKKYLVFPTHYGIDMVANLEEIQVRNRIRYWKELADYQSLTICLFWTEFLDPIWQKVCREEGVQITCAGIGTTNPVWAQHPSRLNFLYRLREILSEHTHCIFETFSSGIFYAISMNKCVGLFLGPKDLPKYGNSSVGDWVNSVIGMDYSWAAAEMPLMINNFAEPESLKDIANDLLGVTAVRPINELKDILKFRRSSLLT